MHYLIPLITIMCCFTAASVKAQTPQDNAKQAQTNDLAATIDPQTQKQETGANEPAPTEANPTVPTMPLPLGRGMQYTISESRWQTLVDSELSTKAPNIESVWLEANNEKFLALWQPDISGMPRGAALIVPNEDSTPLENQQLADIQLQLSEHGWSTLAISLPPQTLNRPPLRPAPVNTAKKEAQTIEKKMTPDQNPKPEINDSEPVDETKVVYDDSSEDLSAGKVVNPNGDSQSSANISSAEESVALAEEATPIPPEDIAQSRIQASIAFLITKQQFNNTIVAEGVGVARALKYLELNTDQSSQTIQTMVFINARHSLRAEPDFDFIKILKGLTFPILDIVQNAPGATELETLKQDQKQRADSARISGVKKYVIRSLNVSPTKSSENRLAKIVRGFLQQNANGQQVTE